MSFCFSGNSFLFDALISFRPALRRRFRWQQQYRHMYSDEFYRKHESRTSVLELGDLVFLLLSLPLTVAMVEHMSFDEAADYCLHWFCLGFSWTVMCCMAGYLPSCSFVLLVASFCLFGL